MATPWLAIFAPDIPPAQRCTTCNGTGKHAGIKCFKCRGTGRK